MPACSLLCSTSHAFDHRVVLVDGDLLSLTEVRNLYVFQLHVEAVADDPATGEKGNVLQNALALIPEARCPYRSNLQGATQFVHDECSQRLALNIICDYEQRVATLCDLLKQREQVLLRTIVFS